jgi:hypothetical protein
MATAHQLSLPEAVIHQRNGPVVDGLGVSYDLRVTDLPTSLARGQCPRF